MWSLWEIVAAIGPVLLTGVGIAVAFIPNVVRYRWWVFVAFIILGSATSFSILQVILSTSASLKETQRAITGGDNFAYVRAHFKAVQGLDGPVPLVLSNHGLGPVYDVRFWISPASADTDSNNAAYWSIDRVRQSAEPTVTPGAWLDIGLSVPPGHYFIEIDARNGHLLESLKVVEYKGQLIEIIDIIDPATNEIIYKSERPPGF